MESQKNIVNDTINKLMEGSAKPKYTIMEKIVRDVPLPDKICSAKWCIISFLTPEKIPSTKYLDVLGFCIYDGFLEESAATTEISELKKLYPEYDFYLIEIGKLYAWDDATKADKILYPDKKLNDLEQNRKENIDKLRLMSEQFKNEKTIKIESPHEKNRRDIADRMKKNLYKDGKITNEEYDMLMKSKATSVNTHKIAMDKERMAVEMKECFNKDYLKVHQGSPYKIAFMTVYSPKKIGGLSQLSFKIRAVVSLESHAKKALAHLKNNYMIDDIFRAPIGYWCPYVETKMDNTEQLMKLNYAMKCHMDNLETERAEFETRKEKMMEQNKEQASVTKKINRRRKRAEDKIKESTSTETTSNSESIKTVDNKETNEYQRRPDLSHIGNSEYEDKINKLFDYLRDDDLAGKYYMAPEKLKEELAMAL